MWCMYKYNTVHVEYMCGACTSIISTYMVHVHVYNSPDRMGSLMLVVDWCTSTHTLFIQLRAVHNYPIEITLHVHVLVCTCML